MKNIALSSESTLDLPKELLEKFNIITLPFTVILGEESGKDGIDFTSDQLFAYYEKTGALPRTSAVNEGEYEAYFDELLKDHDEILHISLSSGISSSYDHAVAASKKYEGKVRVIDSLSLSTGIALLVIYGRQLIDQGLELEEIAQRIEARRPYNQTSFGLEQLEYLYKGGRCSALSYFGANLLKIRPQIIMKADTGKMVSGKKFRGPIAKWVKSYREATLEEWNTPDKSIVFITYTTCPDEVVKETYDYLKGLGFENIYCTRAGATISCHCGPHTLGVLYMNDGK